MRVGDLLELPYFTAGPFPAGNYVVTNGLGGPRDARLHLDLVHRLSGGGDSVFASADVGAGAGSDGGAPGAWSTTLAGPALASTCGDQLVLRVQLVSAASPYLEFLINMTTP